MSPPSASSTAGLKRAPLDVYKKVTIIRKQGDTVVYEDSQGRVQCITDLGDAALAAVRFYSTLWFLNQLHIVN